MWLIAGLGNPGDKYKYNWHNAGFMALDVLSQRHGIKIKKIRCRGLLGRGRIARQKVILLMPQTYMNRSGDSIFEALSYFDIPLENLIVIYDDIDIDKGVIRMREKGGPGTHKGMQSIIQRLGSQDFCRVRIGCGPQPEHQDIANYVLSDIPKTDRAAVYQSLLDASRAIEDLLQENA